MWNKINWSLLIGLETTPYGVQNNRLYNLLQNYKPHSSRIQGKHVQRHLDEWARNVSTRGPAPWLMDDDDDEEEKEEKDCGAAA
jgi:hypothetical protein